MSIVIAIKYKNGVLIGSDKQGTCGNMAVNNVKKIMKSHYSETALGMAGSIRNMDLVFCNLDDLMDYKDVLDKIKLDKKYVVNNIVTKIFNILMKYNRVYKEDGIISIDGEALIVDNDKIFKMYNDGSIIDCENYSVIGSGFQLVQGFLDELNKDYKQLEEEDAYDLLVKSIYRACLNEIYINTGIDYITLKKEEN